MTDDLVKRLRADDADNGMAMGLSGEAADRIEAQAAQIERLKRQIQAKEDGLNVRDRRIEAQAAEIERLRAALKEIVRMYPDNGCLKWACAITASAALGDTQ